MTEELRHELKVEETLSGWNVIKRCLVCKDSPVWVHNSRDKDRATRAVEQKYIEYHMECML